MQVMLRHSLVALLATGLVACSPVNFLPKTPEQVVQAVTTAVTQQDWGTADLYLTQRLSGAIRPGTLPQAWQVGRDPRILTTQIVGRTAHVWVESTFTLAEAAQRASLDETTLTRYITKPDPSDKAFQEAAQRVAGLRLENGQVISNLRITLYQQPEGWRIEIWYPDKAPAAAPTP